MQESIELKLIGITYNQIESGVYALILEDVAGGRRLAIVIGYPEAQSIECKLQGVKTPRPLSHDLMVSILNNLEARLLRIDIHKLLDGPYAGTLTLEKSDGTIVEIDARSSDAVALGIRIGAPIFTTKELIDKYGYSPIANEKNNSAKQYTANIQHLDVSSDSLRSLSFCQLEGLLSKYVEEENYEAAADIKKEIERRQKET